MATRRTADIVFCLDSSGSMGPCFDAVRANIGSLLTGLNADRQSTWDIRFDFISYSASHADSGGVVFGMRSLRADGMKLIEALYRQVQPADPFFTRDVEELRRGLSGLEAQGDEATFVALDTALDFPWRSQALAHRVVIVLTDEALETGLHLREQMEQLPALIAKIHQQRVALHLVAPSSIAFDQLSAADKSEYTVVDETQEGLANVNFAETLAAIGKAISASALQTVESERTSRVAPLFGQAGWTETNAPMRGA
jgi:hypothetical protein